MSPKLKPLFGSEGHNGVGRGNERLGRFVAAVWAVLGLRQLMVRRWKDGTLSLGLALLCFYLGRRERLNRS